ncbi:hypothetical protein PSPO01_16010 [Paraphaeosphaeria sporulosa]
MHSASHRKTCPSGQTVTIREDMVDGRPNGTKETLHVLA